MIKKRGGIVSVSRGRYTFLPSSSEKVSRVWRGQCHTRLGNATRFGHVLSVIKLGFRIKCDSLLHRPRQGAARPSGLPAAVPDEN